MPAGEKVQRTKTLAQLYFRSGSYGKAVQYANQYLKSAPGDQDMQLLIAQAYYQQKDYKSAAATAGKLVKASKRPSEDLLQLAMRCIEAGPIGCTAVWGISANTRAWYDLAEGNAVHQSRLAHPAAHGDDFVQH